ncbi:microtubule-associated protein 9 [Mergus octosetaceus]
MLAVPSQYGRTLVVRLHCEAVWKGLRFRSWQDAEKLQQCAPPLLQHSNLRLTDDRDYPEQQCLKMRKSCPLESVVEVFGQPPASENGVDENVSLQSYCGGMDGVECVYPPHGSSESTTIRKIKTPSRTAPANKGGASGKKEGARRCPQPPGPAACRPPQPEPTARSGAAAPWAPPPGLRPPFVRSRLRGGVARRRAMRAAGPAVREQAAMLGGRGQPAARGRSQAGRRKAQGRQAGAMPGQGGGRRAGAPRGAALGSRRPREQVGCAGEGGWLGIGGERKAWDRRLVRLLPPLIPPQATGELQEAISTHAAREQTAVYSDDFESEEVDMLNGIVEERHKSNSDADSTKKSVDSESPLSDDGASQKAADLENEGVDDLSLSFHERKLQQKTLSESENIHDRINELHCLESKNEDNDRKNNEEHSAAELQCHMSETDHCNDLPMPELKKERKAITLDQKEKKPIPKPRMHKTRNTSASAENISIPSLGGCYKASPQPRSAKRKSSPMKDNEFSKSEEVTPRRGLSSFSAPSSLTSLNTTASSEKKVFAESPSPEGPWLESTSPPFSINFTSHNERSEDSSLLMCGETPLSQDERKDTSPSDLKLEDNISKTLSVIEAMTTTAYEKTKKSEKSTDDGSDKQENIVQGQIETDTAQEVSVDGQSEHVESKNTSEDFVKKQSETKATVLQKSKHSSCRSLSSAHLKKKAKAVPSATAVSSQYLGTLKVLENRHLQNSREFDKADSLRAAVFQNWLEKKRALLLELKRNEKKKAENLRINTEKKEDVKRKEAIASFEAWKAMKAKEAKKLSEKKKLEELKRKKAEEQNAEKMESAQKAFEKWKERKTEYLREQSRKEKQSERIRKRKEEELVEEKKKDNVSAVEKWNEKKEEYIKQKKAEKILERRKQEIQRTKKDEKDKKAIEEYERWLKKTERKEQLERKQKKLQAACGDEVRSPWSPPGKVMYSRNY